jgi:hypothetical protein
MKLSKMKLSIKVSPGNASIWRENRATAESLLHYEAEHDAREAHARKNPHSH